MGMEWKGNQFSKEQCSRDMLAVMDYKHYLIQVLLVCTVRQSYAFTSLGLPPARQ